MYIKLNLWELFFCWAGTVLATRLLLQIDHPDIELKLDASHWPCILFYTAISVIYVPMSIVKNVFEFTFNHRSVKPAEDID